MNMGLLALDIGGANLKAADGLGFAVSQFFPLWQRPDELAAALARLVAVAPAAETLVITMTGELADCFETKAQGVRHILHHARQAAGQRTVLVYLVDGSLVPSDAAQREPLRAAAANWHALARFAGRYCPAAGLLLDIGSTTTDLIPIIDGQPAPAGHTDTERLAAGELVYTGVQRSPVCAVVDALPWRSRRIPVAQELFATMRDVYLLLGDLPEEASDCHTADGRPATQDAAHSRLARMICADRDHFSREDALIAAQAVARGQQSRLGLAARAVSCRMSVPPTTMVLSGQGEFVGRRLVERLRLDAKIVSLAAELGGQVSQAAPAHALAAIARETLS